MERGISYMTFWAFSTENWKRSKREVTTLLSIFRKMIRMRWQKLHEKGVRIRVIGDFSKFPEDIVSSIKEVVEQTKNNTKITVVFAINYGGRDEMIRAINKVLKEKRTNIAESDFSRFLDTEGMPDPDLIVRTGGEERLSGFLLWQSNYSELMFPSWYFPEFTPEKLDGIIADFEKRERRFGA
jgi:undecaprenyl diphosphate synthase